MANVPKTIGRRGTFTDEMLRKMIASGKSIPSKASAK